MSSIPGRTLESWLEWNYSIDQCAPKFPVLVALFEEKREWVEDKLWDFDEDNQSWRDYNSAVFHFDESFEAKVENLLKLEE